jgi:hypothetical protein
MSRPMKKQAALKLSADLPDWRPATRPPLAGPRSGGRLTRPVCSRRMLGSAAAATSYLAAQARRSGSSMFDWPEHSQTSPISRSERVWVSAPSGPSGSAAAPGSRAGRAADQRPWASAVALAAWPERSTATAALGLRHAPHPDRLAALQDGVVGEDRASKGAAEATDRQGGEGGGEEAAASFACILFPSQTSVFPAKAGTQIFPRASPGVPARDDGQLVEPSPGRPRRPDRWSASRPAATPSAPGRRQHERRDHLGDVGPGRLEALERNLQAPPLAHGEAASTGRRPACPPRSPAPPARSAWRRRGSRSAGPSRRWSGTTGRRACRRPGTPRPACRPRRSSGGRPPARCRRRPGGSAPPWSARLELERRGRLAADEVVADVQRWPRNARRLPTASHPNLVAVGQAVAIGELRVVTLVAAIVQRTGRRSWAS